MTLKTRIMAVVASLFLVWISVHAAIPFVLDTSPVSQATAPRRAAGRRCPATAEEQQPLHISVVFDNYETVSDFGTGWGFSCLVEGRDQSVLFDTGDNGWVVTRNLEAFGFDPADLEIVFLSHEHYDHTGGLASMVEEQHTVYLLESFPAEIKAAVLSAGATMIEVEDPLEILPGVYSTGRMGFMQEQSLVVETPRGLVVVAGCAHPGIVNIVEQAMEMTGRDVYLALGGFHLVSSTDSRIRMIIEQLQALGVEKIGPTHCSGDRARELFSEAWGEGYLELGAGSVVTVGASGG